MDSKKLYLIHRNKHREAAKTKRQRYMTQMKEQIKTMPNKIAISIYLSTIESKKQLSKQEEQR